MTRLSIEADDTGRHTPIHGPEAIAALREAGRIAALTLDHIAPLIRPGISTAEIDHEADAFMRAAGAVAATIGYKGYAHASCISINHVAAHGIPSDTKRLKAGDIVNVDVTPLVDGWHGDTSRTFGVGRLPLKLKRLVLATFEAMWAGIDAVRPGARLGDIGAAIQARAAADRLTVLTSFCGHGTGRIFHDAPQVLHVGRAGDGMLLEPGMVFTIEPMLTTGRDRTTILPDGWTAVTADRAPTAQFEHTVAVTNTGVEVLTLSPDDPSPRSWNFD